MAFYIRPDQVPELQGLNKMEQRILLRGTFLKERAISTVFLLIAIVGSVQFALNPVLQHAMPALRTDSMAYAGILIAWLFILMAVRDIILMNMLRPKFAAKRAEATASKVAILESERNQET